MALTSYLQAVTRDELDALERDPASITRLDKDDAVSTHYFASINYFLTGDAYPSGDEPLAQALSGSKNVRCSVLENGSFDVVFPEQTSAIHRALGGVELERLGERVLAADFETLVEEQELYELELVGPEQARADIVSDVRQVTAFYARAAAKDLGVVMYTT